MPDRCSCCGHLIGAEAEPLVAACDVLVLRALELVGKRMLRSERSRFRRLGDRRVYEVHTLWQADPDSTNKGLADAWIAVPGVLADHGCCGADPAGLSRTLDRYVRDLLITGTGHDVSELRYRLDAYLGVAQGR